MKNTIKRTSFDLSNETVRQADDITRELQHASRKDTMAWCIGLATQLVESLKQGLRLVLIDKEGVQKPFSLDGANVQPRPEERTILARIGQEDVLRLLEITRQPGQHPAAETTLRLAMAAIDPQGPKHIEASVFFDLIYWALRLNDTDFLALVRDVVTVCVTAFKSFDALLNAQNYTPYFDSNLVEQRFLSDEYIKEKRKQLIS
jgi:hypothetical protein